MIRPDPKIVKQVATMVRQYPDILEWLENWRTHELDNLPSALNNTAVSQGRCQVLGELVKFAKESPDMAAKL
jgi:hypothetical protein